ncbi:hypothetical protein HDU67_010380 [Dinochytrium kinnereticum]|nr:hypothetical protein HDU67_010380 [Dinochytrium kinnereticum]
MDLASKAGPPVPDRDLIVSTIREHWVKRGGTVSSTRSTASASSVNSNRRSNIGGMSGAGPGGDSDPQEEWYGEDEEEGDERDEYLLEDEGIGLPSPSMVTGIGAMMLAEMDATQYDDEDDGYHDYDEYDEEAEAVHGDRLLVTSTSHDVPLKRARNGNSPSPAISPLNLPPEISRAINLIDSEDAWKALEKEIEKFDAKSPPASGRSPPAIPARKGSFPTSPNNLFSQSTGKSSAPSPSTVQQMLKPTFHKIHAPSGPSKPAGPQIAPRNQSRTEIAETPARIRKSTLDAALAKASAETSLSSSTSKSKPTSKGKSSAPVVIPARSASHTYTKDDFSQYKSKYKKRFELEEAMAAAASVSSSSPPLPGASVYKTDVREDAMKRLDQFRRDASQKQGEAQKEGPSSVDSNADTTSWATKTMASAFATKSLPRNFSLDRERLAYSNFESESKKAAVETKVDTINSASTVGFEGSSVIERLAHKFRDEREESSVEPRKAEPEKRKPSFSRDSDEVKEVETAVAPPLPAPRVAPKATSPIVQKKPTRKPGGIVLYDASQQEPPTEKSSDFVTPNPSPANNINGSTTQTTPAFNYFAPTSSPVEPDDSPTDGKPTTAIGMISSVFSMFSGSASPSPSPPVASATTSEKEGTGTLTRGRRAPPPTQLIITPKPHKDPRESFIAPNQPPVVPTEPIPSRGGTSVPSRRGSRESVIAVPPRIGSRESIAVPPRIGSKETIISSSRRGEPLQRDVEKGSFDFASDSSDDETVDEVLDERDKKNPPPITVAQGFKVSVERANKRNSYLRRSLSNPELAKSLTAPIRFAPNEEERGRTIYSRNAAGVDPRAAILNRLPTVNGRYGAGDPSAQQSVTPATPATSITPFSTTRKPLKSALKAPRKPTEEEIRIADEAERNIEYFRNKTLGKPYTRSSSVDNTNRAVGFSNLDDEQRPVVKRMQGSSLHVKGVIDRDHIVAVIVDRGHSFLEVRQRIQDKIAATGSSTGGGGVKKAVLGIVRRRDGDGNLITIGDEEDWGFCVAEAGSRILLFLDVGWV